MIKIPGMKTIDLPVTGGLDEITPVNKIPLDKALKMENFRISRDGKRVEKRLGLVQDTEYGADGYGVHVTTGFGEDVYGYSTYYDMDGHFNELAILESGIVRKDAGGHWTDVWPFVDSNGDPTTVSHPVRPLEIQGKQFVIHENDSRMIHHDKEDYQIGITAPTTLPTVTTSHSADDTLPLEDTFAYANTAAMDAVWTDDDAGNGQSTIATSGPTTQGPDAHNLYLKLTSSAVSTTSVAKRSLTMSTSIGSKYTIEINTYLDLIRGVKNVRDFQLKVYNGAFRLPIYFLKGNLCIYDSKGKQFSFTTSVVEDKWVAWKFIVDGTDSTAISVSAYKDGIFLKRVVYGYADETNTDLIELIGNSKATSGNASIIYVDNIKVTTETPVAAVKTGSYRYAVTFFREGNYGCESNPIKSIVGGETFSGVGVDDLTTGGTYTYGGASSYDPLRVRPDPPLNPVASETTSLGTKIFRVEIDGNGTPDTFKWSEDDGATWVCTEERITTKNYLSYGVEITFATTTSHTIGDYWSFTCSACIAAAANEIINLADIPTSSDSQVTGRNIYRSTVDGSRFYWLATINDNAQTTFKDNISDLALGYEMEEDHDVAPDGKFSAWWDERLWISGDDIVYFSQYSYPEHFGLHDRYITVQRGDMSDEITGLVPYKDSLYVFRKKSIYVIQKTVSGYGLFLVTDDVGCVAPFSIVSVNNMLMFISHRGIELFNGTDVYGVELSLPIDRTIKTIDMTKTDFICGVNNQEKREVMWSIPDRLSSGTALTVVYHCLADAWYIFYYYGTSASVAKVPSCLVSCYDSTKVPVLKMGTRDGYLALCESTYLDNATAITAIYRKPWYECGEMADVRRLDGEYEIPTGKTLTVNIYVNFDKDIQRTDGWAGETISSTDIELRRPHLDFSELGQRAKYVSVEFTNAENLGGDLKLNEITLYVRDRAVKGKAYGD